MALQLPDIWPPSQKFTFVALWVETLFYGVYVTLFCICIHILYHRKRVIFLFGAIIMFALSTAHVILRLVYVKHMSSGLERAATIIYLINNVAADELVVFRCYIVWGKLKRIIIIPTLLVLTTAVLSYISETPTVLITSLITNFIVSGLTAGRIWWIGRQARGILSKEITKTYDSAIIIILESGALYCKSLLICLIVSLYSPASEVTLGALAQIVGIVPTLIIVRVGLGRSIDNVESLTGPIAFNHEEIVTAISFFADVLYLYSRHGFT